MTKHLQPARLVLGFHNHQPVGNFDGVFAQNYDQAYLPLIETFSEFPAVKFNLHISGPLWEWLEANRPCYFDRLAVLIERGQLELLAGAWSEPILPMIPRRDRIGQIQHFSEIITKRFGWKPRGLWLAERVWEQDLVESLARAGVEYTVLDDYHFHRAGLAPDKLGGYFLTEDQGQYVQGLFPNSEPLRYLVPWQEPEKTIEHLLQLADSETPHKLAITADDGEKFGGWPGTHDLIYKRKWLARFLTMLQENQEKIVTSTFSEVIDTQPPLGRIYVPPASYREMAEWVLPTERLELYQTAQKNLEIADAEFSEPIRSFFAPGGYWRNFLVKYREAGEMAAHMNAVSLTVDFFGTALKGQHYVEKTPEHETLLQSARADLYRAQCNCPYWHGAFGGLYLPHLRNAIYKHLILALNAIDRVLKPDGEFIRCLQGHFNLDGHEQIRLENRHVRAWINPAQGGQIYEFDDRRTATNVLATLNRRLEPYHHAVAKAAQKPAEDSPEGPSNLHDRITLKHDGLDELLVYDRHPRKALVDHLWPLKTTLGCLVKGVETERAPWPLAEYQLAEVQESEDNVAVVLAHEFHWDGRLLKLEKNIRLNKMASALDVTYKIQGLADRSASKFAIEINMAAMAGYEHDRQFRDHHGNDLGKLSSSLQLQAPESLTAVDGWLNLANRIEWLENGPEEVWTMPIQTVSNSEGGYEKVFQSSAVFAVWVVGGEADTFTTRFRWSLGAVSN